MNPAAAPHPPELSTAQVRALLDTSGAVALLPDHLPVPVHIETQWWHVPLTSAEPDAGSHEASRPEASRPEASRPEASRPEASRPEASRDEARTHEARYVVAPPDQATVYDRLAARLAASAAATRRPPPRCEPAP